MAARSEPATAPSDREIVVTRVFEAPRELVFDTWTDPEHVGRWWGPRGFTTTTSEMDVRPGGVWRFVMHGPDGTDYKNRIVFLEIARPERLAYQHAGEEGAEDVTFHTTVTFADEGGKTRLTMRAVFPSAAARDHAAEKYGAVEGAEQHLERLGEHLARLAGGRAADREIVSARVFDAPRDRVFEAFRDPARLARWWGPRGFTNTVHEFDLRPGGVWRLTMHGPDGTDYHNESVFVEVAAPERVVFEHREPVHRFRMTMTLADHAGKTKLTWRMLFDSAEECAKVRTFVAAANEQNFDRLGEELATMTPAGEEFVVTRVVAAPRALVFRAWTETEHLTRWFGPKGMTTVASKNDPRPGGVFLYRMRAADGREMWGKWVYREVVPPERLVFVQSFADPEGNIVRSPFSADWPLEVLSTVTFAEQDGKTTITLRGVPLNATDAERRTFEAGHGSMRQGWKGTLDQLEGYLATARAR